MPALQPDELAGWIRFIYEVSGVQLDAAKGYLIETRLANLMRETGAASFGELLMKTRGNATRALRRKVIDAITTHETSFFRDTAPFDMLRHKLLPEMIDRRARAGTLRQPIRIWCAACSTGQEVYSIGIVCKEVLGDLSRYDVRILGTDIADTAIAQASYGLFSALEIERGLPPDARARHFTAVGDKWKVRDELRALANFKTMNLLEPFTFPAPFDLIVCRNVAIYFNEGDRIRMFTALGRVLARDGALIIGATESLSGMCPQFEAQRYLRAVYYQLK